MLALYEAESLLKHTCEKLRKAQDRTYQLETAIANHMNAKGHERCWLNDLELYSVIDPEFDKMKLALPCMPEFLHQCCLYWRDSQPPEARKLGDSDGSKS